MQRIFPQEIPDDWEIPFDEQEDDDRISPKEIQEYDEIPSHELKSDDCMLPQEIQDNDDMPPEEQEGFEQILPKYQVFYCQIFQFEETEDILLFNRRNYKVLISMSLIANNMHPVNCVFDIVAGANLIREDLLETDGRTDLQANSWPSSKHATN